MARSGTSVSEDRIKSRLYLVVEAGPTAAERLAAALAAADIASVLIRAGNGIRLDARNAQPLVVLAQAKGAAALIEADAELARALRADGVHLLPSDDVQAAYETARGIVGGRAIVGGDAGRSRDDAMMLAEAGADYVAFSPDGEGGAEARDELAAWWAEIFEVPCVALGVESPGEAAGLQAAKCEFIGISLPTAVSADEVRGFVAAIAGALAQHHAEASG